jgi:tetratricopeptide (TPR) repeat protein
MIDSSSRRFESALDIPLPRAAVERIEQLAPLAVPPAVIHAFMQRIGVQDVALDPAELRLQLLKKADEYLALRDRLRSLNNEDTRISALRQRALKMIDAVDFIQADAQLSKAESIDFAAIEELEDASDLHRKSIAASRSERAAIAYLRVDYGAAAEHFRVAADVIPKDQEAAWNYRLKQAEALFDSGLKYGDNLVLSEAIQLYREKVLPCAPRCKRPYDWATTQNSLANTLLRLGERESGTARLEEAVAAYRAALEADA